MSAVVYPLDESRRRQVRVIVALAVLVASIIAVPGATPAHSAADPAITYVFQFANDAADAEGGAGRLIEGTATSNDVDVTVDGRDMRIKMNCDDLFRLYAEKFGGTVDRSHPDWGFGTKKDPDKGDPDHFRVWDFFLFDETKNVFCGNVDMAPDSVTLPVIFGPGQFQFQIIFAANNNVDGITNGPGEVVQGSSDSNTPTVTLFEQPQGCVTDDQVECVPLDLVLHVSCSDRWHLWVEDSPNDTPLPRDDTNPLWGYGEKDDPTVGSDPPHPRIWDLFIFKLGSDKKCGNPDFTVGEPDITVEKTPDSQEPVDTLVVFTITVTNTGDVPLTGAWVADDKVITGGNGDRIAVPECARSIADVRDGVGIDSGAVGVTFEVDEVFWYTCEFETADGLTNTATAVATFESTGLADVDDAVVEIPAPSSPDITVEKTPDSQEPVDTLVVFTITVTNTGDVPLTGAWVADDKVITGGNGDRIAVPECARSIADVRDGVGIDSGAVGVTFEVDEVFWYTCAFETADGLTNTATAVATWESTGLADVDTAVVEVNG